MQGLGMRQRFALVPGASQSCGAWVLGLGSLGLGELRPWVGRHCDTHPVDQHRQWGPLKLSSGSLQRVQVKWDGCSVS